MAGRGRGRGWGRGGSRFAAQLPFALFPEDVSLPDVKLSIILRELAFKTEETRRNRGISQGSPQLQNKGSCTVGRLQKQRKLSEIGLLRSGLLAGTRRNRDLAQGRKIQTERERFRAERRNERWSKFVFKSGPGLKNLKPVFLKRVTESRLIKAHFFPETGREKPAGLGTARDSPIPRGGTTILLRFSTGAILAAIQLGFLSKTRRIVQVSELTRDTDNTLHRLTLTSLTAASSGGWKPCSFVVAEVSALGGTSNCDDRGAVEMAGRGRGRGWGRGGSRFAAQVPFALFPEDVSLPDVKLDEIDANMKKLLSWGYKFKNYCNASPYFVEETSSKGSKNMDIERFSDKKKTMFTRDSLSQVLMFNAFPREVVPGTSKQMPSRKKFRWNPELELKKLDFFEQQEKRSQGREDKDEKEKKDGENEDEDENAEDDEGEEDFSDDDYNQNEYFDDDEDDYNDVDDGNDEITY